MPRKKADISFQAFWKAYGEAYGAQVARKEAVRAWQRLTDRDKRAALRGIAPYSESCRRQGIAMKYAQGYLSGRRWEDRLPQSGQSPAPPSQPPKPEDVFDDMDTW